MAQLFLPSLQTLRRPNLEEQEHCLGKKHAQANEHDDGRCDSSYETNQKCQLHLQSLRVAVIQGDANEHQPARTVTMQCTKTLTMIMQDKSTKNLTAIFIYPQRKKADA